MTAKQRSRLGTNPKQRRRRSSSARRRRGTRGGDHLNEGVYRRAEDRRHSESKRVVCWFFPTVDAFVQIPVPKRERKLAPPRWVDRSFSSGTLTTIPIVGLNLPGGRIKPLVLDGQVQPWPSRPVSTSKAARNGRPRMRTTPDDCPHGQAGQRPARLRNVAGGRCSHGPRPQRPSPALHLERHHASSVQRKTPRGRRGDPRRAGRPGKYTGLAPSLAETATVLWTLNPH
jgi:hypothetical protein